MARYDVPTPNTLLFRAVIAERAPAALRLLAQGGPAVTLPAAVSVYTLADVASGPDAAPVAACAVAHDPGSPDAWIDRFVVALPFRGRGLGRRLIAETATALRAKGVRRAFVRAAPGDDAILRLLGRAGVISGARPARWWSAASTPGEDGRAWSWLGCDL